MAHVSSNDSAAEKFPGKTTKTTGEINKWKDESVKMKSSFFMSSSYELLALFEHKKLVCRVFRHRRSVITKQLKRRVEKGVGLFDQHREISFPSS